MSKVGEKGFQTLIKASILRKEVELNEKLVRMKASETPVFVHAECRKRFIDSRKYCESNDEPKPKRLRSCDETVFDWKNCCFYCENRVDAVHRQRNEFCVVETLECKQNIIDQARKRDDEAGQKILSRMQDCIDLPAVEAIYHKNCSRKFFLHESTEKQKCRGRPRDDPKHEAFKTLRKWLETKTEVYTVQELHLKMKELSNNSDQVYCLKRFRQILKAEFSDTIYFVAAAGSSGEQVCFKDATDSILRNVNKHENTDISVTIATAKLIREQVRKMNAPAFYPTLDEICAEEEDNDCVSNLLEVFLQHLIPSTSATLKRQCISQCILQAMRPRTLIQPIPFALGVSFDKSFGSKWLIQTLSRLGICIGPEEVLGFKESSIQSCNVTEPIEKEPATHSFNQWVGDNVDHNLVTLTENLDFDCSFLKSLYEKAMDNNLSEEEVQSILSSGVFSELYAKIEDLKIKMQNKSRTARLWVQYSQYIETAKLFIAAERTSNWDLHLYAVSQMLNVFAATGHGNYAKSARLYLQDMRDLESSHTLLYHEFMQGKHTVKRSAKFWAGLWTDLTIEQTLMRFIKSSGGCTRGRGMTEAVRHLWALSLNSCALVHSALMKLTNTRRNDQEHAELSKSRTSQDYHDTSVFYQWLKARNPFLVESQDLLSLSTGLVLVVEKDSVNCEKSEEIGKKIQESFHNKSIPQCTIPRNSIVRNMASLFINNKTKPNVYSTDETNMMFVRLVAVAERMESLEPAFEYELTPEPKSLFHNGLMRKSEKSALRKALIQKDAIVSIEVIKSCTNSVLDGGALLHKVRWVKGIKFKEVAETYLRYIKTNYTLPIVIFDGYPDTSIKTQEHLRRYPVPLSSYVDIVPENKVPFNQDRYLSSKENKSAFIKFLTPFLCDAGVKVKICKDDADCFVVKEALTNANHNEGPVLVVADDTDIFVMLLYHWKSSLKDIVFLSERSQSAWSISKSQKYITDLKEHLLFLHSFSGCDTTSATYSKGKGGWIKAIRKSTPMKNASRIISNKLSSPGEVGAAAVNAFEAIYNGKSGQGLTKLRYVKYMEMACKGIISPEKLPPTEHVAYYHGLRAHYQVMVWMAAGDDCLLNPTDWGWELKSHVLVPIISNFDIAPATLTKVIRCNCNISLTNPCSTKICSCKKFGISCVASCGNCHGEDCCNVQEATFLIDSESDDEHHDIYDDFERK